MKYLLDTHSLSNNVVRGKTNRDDLTVLQDVADEFIYSQSDSVALQNSGIKFLFPERRHYLKLKEVLSKHGDNLKLIRLYTREGTADVMMLAYVLEEMNSSEKLFSEEYCLVTQDKELIKIAQEYGIKTVAKIS